VPASGGTIERLIEAPRVRFPELLPGGRAIVFNVIAPEGPSRSDIAVETLDTHERTTVVRGGTFPRFVASGHLVFARSGKLLAVPFDPATRTTSGNPVVVGEDVMVSEAGRAYFRNNGTGQFAVSRAGNLAYVAGGVYTAQLHVRRHDLSRRETDRLGSGAAEQRDLAARPGAGRLAASH
jgi:hypothetical protein